MQSDKELYETLKTKRDNGEPLKPAERSKLKELEKEYNKPTSKPKSEGRKSKLTEPNDSDKSPKLVRFVHAERKVITNRKDDLLANSEEVKAALGSVNLASEDLIIRALALMAHDVPDKKLLKYMKQALMNN